ncbi:E3 ubiquitin-protein ligase TRIM39-like [Betta splendens]|uniref:E3 ubiquitin-protein ligase TRIM39-like n=1 Tax=Betta splendens TaxID=158456 RepID=A0A6P7LA74_BETSP|nr:E3 ubiquitin-protein ligase TRIM39-like [Betta splendens]
MSLQVCHCGWSKVTSYQGLRTHQGKMGCTPKGMGIPEREQYRFSSYSPSLSVTTRTFQLTDPCTNIFTSSLNFGSSLEKSLQGDQGTLGSTPWGWIPEREQNTRGPALEESRQNDSGLGHTTHIKEENVPFSPTLISDTSPARIEMLRTLKENQQQFGQIGANVHNGYRSPDFNPTSQALTSTPQSVTMQKYPAASHVTVQGTKTSVFETPQLSHRTATDLTGKARRALDFSTGSQQATMTFEIPTTAAQQTVAAPKDEELKRQREWEEKEEAQKLLKARQDRMRAELQQTIQLREHRIDEVNSSLKACKVSLDAEWLEINSVFSEVMKTVDDARQKALQPLEERRQKVKQKAQYLVQKLEREIDKLKGTMDELDTNPDLQVCTATGVDESREWKKVNVDTSFSLGSLKTTTSAMMEQIQNSLENLSSIELKRISKFAVDVKLDPATAHQCLDVSKDGKNVRDAGQNQMLPDAPGRFDQFGSILGRNRLTSGRSYWEVEVSNKTGWDLGVARGNANRKGVLSLTPADGYWVTVHYENTKFAAMTAPPVKLSLKEKPRKVGVFVDHDEGLVSFYDVTAQSHMYSFTECSFGGEVFPYFSPHLKENGKNSGPLIITTV